jgi:hypothetical protein
MKREWTDLELADWTLLPSDAALLVFCNRRVFTMSDLFEDLVDSFGPDEWHLQSKPPGFSRRVIPYPTLATASLGVGLQPAPAQRSGRAISTLASRRGSDAR